MGLQGVTRGLRGLQGIIILTEDYNRLQKDFFGTRTFQDTFS